MNTLTFTSKVILGRKPAIENKLAAMWKKAKKMGLPPISWHWVACDSPVWVYEDSEGFRYSSESPPAAGYDEHRYTGIMLQRAEIVVTGEAPVFAGWKFVAKLTPTVDRKANLLMTIPGYTDTQLAAYVDQVGICEHCNQRSDRKDTYVVQHVDGHMKAVGKQCLAAFVGGLTPEKIVKWGEFLFEIPNAISDGESDLDHFRGAREILSIEMLPLLTIAAAVIEEYGWCSRGDANDMGRPASADFVWSYFFDKKFDKTKIVVLDEHKVAAQNVLEWMKTCEGNEYMTNLRTLSAQECVAHTGLGLAVSAVHSWRRNTAERTTEARINEYYGVVGSRNVETVTLYKLVYIDSYYGQKCLRIFRTKAGITLSWFASGGGNWFKESEIGTEADIDFRIKKHEEYRGQRQTLITHVGQITKVEA